MTTASGFEGTAPIRLVGARNMAHKAVQLLTRASLANLEPEPDDSHTNMGWDNELGAFLTHPMPTSGGELSVGLAVASSTLLIAREGSAIAGLELEGVTDEGACDWLDGQLGRADLEPASAAELHYELPTEVSGIEVYARGGIEGELATLAMWFALAESLLERFTEEHAAIHPGPSPVRCWPHHFDIATYVRLEEGDPETARGIGVGLSPGDGSYGQPYFYVTPFPAVEIADLPLAPEPGHWHSEGFVGAIATGDEILTLSDVPSGAAAFLEQAFAIGRQKLGFQQPVDL